jgi:hypothetical protein
VGGWGGWAQGFSSAAFIEGGSLARSGNPLYHRPTIPRRRMRRVSDSTQAAMKEGDLEGGGGGDHHDMRSTMTLSGAQGDELAREVLQSIGMGNIRRASTLDLETVPPCPPPPPSPYVPPLGQGEWGAGDTRHSVTSLPKI